MFFCALLPKECKLIHMNTNATYRTRRQRVRGAVNGFIWHRGFTGEKHVSEEPSSGSHEKSVLSSFFENPRKLMLKIFQPKLLCWLWRLVVTLMVDLFQIWKRVFAVENKLNLLVISNLRSVNFTSTSNWKFCEFWPYPITAPLKRDSFLWTRISLLWSVFLSCEPEYRMNP